MINTIMYRMHIKRQVPRNQMEKMLKPLLFLFSRFLRMLLYLFVSIFVVSHSIPLEAGVLVMLAALWQSKIADFESVGDIDWAVDLLYGYLEGRDLSQLQQAKLTSLSDASKAVLACQIEFDLTSKAHALINYHLVQLESSAANHRSDVSASLTDVAGIYSRWRQCCIFINRSVLRTSRLDTF